MHILISLAPELVWAFGPPDVSTAWRQNFPPAVALGFLSQYPFHALLTGATKRLHEDALCLSVTIEVTYASHSSYHFRGGSFRSACLLVHGSLSTGSCWRCSSHLQMARTHEEKCLQTANTKITHIWSQHPLCYFLLIGRGSRYYSAFEWNS